MPAIHFWSLSALTMTNWTRSFWIFTRNCSRDTIVANAHKIGIRISGGIRDNFNLDSNVDYYDNE